jgi:hypothetical protein
MLELFAFTQIDEIETEVGQIYSQQDGAPPHFHNHVRDVLDDKFQDRWIGRGGPIQWPPRRPDLTPMDFFLILCKKHCLFSEA